MGVRMMDLLTGALDTLRYQPTAKRVRARIGGEPVADTCEALDVSFGRLSTALAFVPVYAENGRKALFLNPVRMESIVGMEDQTALALIDKLMQHATQNKYEYRHKWRHGNWVLWDNRSVMHQANPDYDMRERRYLYRLLLKGETPV